MKDSLNKKFRTFVLKTLCRSAIDLTFFFLSILNSYDTQGNIKESLSLEIWTNGSISPKRAIQESIKTLMNLFYPLLMNTSFISLTSNANKDLLDVKQLNKLSNT